ncbi:hypothetical protein B0H66DRAFT_576105 [Apodospora peruviana]|uniref:Uncharacterized protein n=1 Tax=Apodospora peruviana TaxID=516989 RepID=A0AAE0M321_9PEZI|nr:hypothetical protein B0H66DRAFT_576105 [Apodospora peruviana]
MSTLQVMFALWVLFAPGIQSFSWGSERRVARPANQNPSPHNDISPSELLQHSSSRLPKVYAVALSELQELESEPLCHRVAARLLVNNCQLVDGKDDATILTDSGRQVRDFVDSYAASLAICDLERGSFAIPTACAKFREPSLSLIAIRNEPQLHVTPSEIGLCLSALATSDAAWSTWISYRHKALRFCEAARADNEKSQNILLYQRLTQVIAKLTEGVEAELQKRMDDLDNRARQSVENLEKLSPQIDHLRNSLTRVESYLLRDMESSLAKSSESMHDSLQNAEDLRQILNVLVASVLENNSRLASAHEVSLRQASQKVDEDLGALVAVVASVAASSSSLQKQIELSNQQAAALAQRQDALEQGMGRLLIVTETLATKYQDHTHMLNQASNITNDILDALDEASTTVSQVNSYLFKDGASGSWWPYLVFPTISLVMGSYGLPPSAFRNLGLLALGEAIGYLVSSYDQLIDRLPSSSFGGTGS